MIILTALSLSGLSFVWCRLWAGRMRAGRTSTRLAHRRGGGWRPIMAGMLSRPCARFLLVGELVFLRERPAHGHKKTTDWRFLRVGYKRVGLLRCLTLWSGREDSIGCGAALLPACISWHGWARPPPPHTHTHWEPGGARACHARQQAAYSGRAPEVGCLSPVACWRLLAQPVSLHVDLCVASSGMCGGSQGEACPASLLVCVVALSKGIPYEQCDFPRRPRPPFPLFMYLCMQLHERRVAPSLCVLSVCLGQGGGARPCVQQPSDGTLCCCLE